MKLSSTYFRRVFWNYIAEELSLFRIAPRNVGKIVDLLDGNFTK